MSHLSPDPYFFHTEATMPPDVECYIERAADAALLKALRERKYSIMLSSRKVGKSSLLEHSFVRLRQEGIMVVKKELAEAGESVTEESWYAGLVQELVNDASLRNDFTVDPAWRDWWDARKQLPPGQRFTDFLRQFFLLPCDAPWVIAIDEIDTTIPLGFSDDFFAAVRRCQNARAADPVFGRLTFLLAGVASPAQLIKDNRRTPFNIGHAVGLTDFTAEEAKVLLRGLGEPEENTHPALQRVLYWTGGHPYLTQRIFHHLAEVLENTTALEAVPDWQQRVDDAVQATFLLPGARTTEPHLHDIARRRIGGMRGIAKRRVLAIYERALRGKIVKDDALAAPIVELKLCGLLVCDPHDPQRLMMRNLIYCKVFDVNWVREEMPRNIWQAGGAVSMIVAGVAIGVVIWQAEQAKIASLSAQIARADADVPQAAYAELVAIKGQAQLANKLLGQYWAKKARIASVERPRDEAALLWLKALTVDATPEAAIQARNALAGYLPQVEFTLRHADTINHAEFSPDGRRVVTASDDGTARLWDSETGLPLGKPMQHKDSVRHAAFSPDGRRIVTASDDRTARLWDSETGLPLGKPMQHKGRAVHAAFSPGGRRIVTASDYSPVRLWDSETGLPLGNQFPGKAIGNSLPITQHGGRIIAIGDSDTVWLLRGGPTQALGKPLKGKCIERVNNISPDGQMCGNISNQKQVTVWDTETGQSLGKPVPLNSKLDGAIFTFTAAGKQLFIHGNRRSGRMWDIKTGLPIGEPVPTGINDQLSQDGRLLASTVDDRFVRLWDITTGGQVAKPFPIGGDLELFALSPDGRRLAISIGNGIRLWDTATGGPLSESMEGIDFYKVIFGSDSQHIATINYRIIQVWQTEPLRPKGKLIQHHGNVYDVSFGLQGRRLLTRTWRTLNWFILTSNNEWVPEKTIWRNDGLRFRASKSDQNADTVRIVEGLDDGTLLVRNVSVHNTAEEGLPELPGKPADLLAKYQKTFALRFENEQKSAKLVPVYPVGVQSDNPLTTKP